MSHAELCVYDDDIVDNKKREILMKIISRRKKEGKLNINFFRSHSLMIYREGTLKEKTFFRLSSFTLFLHDDYTLIHILCEFITLRSHSLALD
jgi:hypothetical protein